MHGLTGNSRETWSERSTQLYWPADLLPNDVTDARILSFGYDADIVNFWSPASQNSVSSHAQNLNGRLEQLRAIDESVSDLRCFKNVICVLTIFKDSHAIIFIAHSLGGLIVQKALCLSRHSGHPHIQSIAQHTIAILFLGTPHLGSSLAPWAALGKRFAKLVAQPNDALIDVLQPGSTMLADIEHDFHQLLRAMRNEGIELHITCFFEELPLAGKLGEV